jgi:glycosyltransferase involved in cell wall biosynthesis
MMARPCVSVIIIFLNPGRYLDEAIHSVLSQTLTDWELILVDDGSDDGSTVTAQRWAEKLPAKIRYVHHDGHANRGMSASRNVGIGVARGDYVAFLDADDVFLPDRLLRHVSILKERPEVAMVQSQQIYWYCWQGSRASPQEQTFRRAPLHLGDAIIHPPIGLRLLFGVPDWFTNVSSITVRREVALALGGFEDQFRGLYEDQVFLTKVYANHTVYALQANLAKYRLHQGGTVHATVKMIRGPKSAYFDKTRQLRDWQFKYLRGLAIDDTITSDLLEKHLHRAHSKASVVSNLAKMIIRRTIHEAAKRILPLPAYRRLLRYRQSSSTRAMRSQHARLCQKIAEYEVSQIPREPA